MSMRRAPSTLRQKPADLPGWLFWLGLFLLLLIAAVPRLWALGEPSLWTDEVFTLFRAQAPFRDALESMWNAGNQNPLYYVVLRLFSIRTELDLRLPGAVLGVLGVLAMGIIAWRLTGSRMMGLWAGALLAINPFHIMLSRNARAYSLMFLVSLLAFYAFLRLLQGRRSRQMWILFILSSMAAYLTHFASAVLGIAQLVLLLWLRRTDRAFLVRWFKSQVIAGLPFVIWMISIALNLESTYKSSFATPDPLEEVPVTLLNLVIGYDGTFDWNVLPGLLAVMLLLVVGWHYIIKRHETESIGLYSLLVIGSALVPVILIAVTVSPSYQDRYFTAIMPAMILSILLAARILGPRWGGLLLVVVLFTAGNNTLEMFRDSSYERTDWRSVDRLVRAGFQPGDGLLMERDHPLMNFEHYYSGDPRWLNQAQLLRDEPDTGVLEAETERIWVIYRNPIEDFHRQGAMPEFDPFDPDLNIVGEWLAERRSQVILLKEFQGVTVVLVESKSEDEITRIGQNPD